MPGININQLANEISKAVGEYTEDVTEAIKEEVNDTTNDVYKEVRSNYPYNDRTGKYSKGWKKTKQDKSGKMRRVVWNKDHYRRVHLLEFGHASRNGGRVKAYPHLVPAYEKHGAKLPEKIKKIIQKGGR
ncbi:HK97 gp10 family phage protein [Alkalicella caledoniensis]|uniref:HK97 gp10 family phage protein n=1 Tax=Alkalicella caledoniensis TaxID=2731377 RepID=A0A7G9W8B3_ALKCA|nr:HK97 gp10 family phage protein [Alkalicella caledoniensis]QNO14925.1 HK97 gp10 family phage protein [Alkalicella caledoniensis]